MNKNDLINQIDKIINAKRIYRDEASKFVLSNPETFSFLLELVFENQDRTAIKSAWVLELVCQKNILLVANHLDYFIDNLYKTTNESALRPVSKVCSMISKSCDTKKIKLTNNQKEKLIESNFEWIITNHKIATQVFAMDTLYLIGKEYDWVHNELKLILEKNTSSGSAGYQSRAKKILIKLK